MNVDASRVWPPAMVLGHPQHPPPLDHESQNQNQPYAQHHHHHPDPNLVYQQHQQDHHQQVHNFAMNRPPQYDLGGHNAPLSYPPPPPPGAARTHSNSSYGQAPQGAPYPPPQAPSVSIPAPVPAPTPRRRDGRSSPKPESYYAPNAAELYNHAQMINNNQSPSPGPDGSGSSATGRDHYPSSVPRLPPILQVEKQQVTTSATQAASASRRRNEAHFVCPVPGCGSTFTRRFNLRGHLRSHTEERPYVCDWPGCKKGFARQHDCKRHQALHSTKSQSNLCPGCKKTFSRLDALNRHLRSEGGQECRQIAEAKAAEAISSGTGPNKKRRIDGDEDWENHSEQGTTSRT